MLGEFITPRIALPHSPTRERREIFFADKQQSPEGAGEKPRGLFEKMTGGVRTLIDKALGRREKAPDAEDQSTQEKPGNPVGEIARETALEIGIQTDVSILEAKVVEEVCTQGEVHDLLRQSNVLNPADQEHLTDLKKKEEDAIEKGLSDEAKRLSKEASEVVAASIRNKENKENSMKISLRLTDLLEARAENYEHAVRSITNAVALDEKAEELANDLFEAEGENNKDAGALADRTERLKRADEKLKKHLLRTLSPEEWRKIETALDQLKKPKDPAGPRRQKPGPIELTSAQKKVLIGTIFPNVRAALRRKWAEGKDKRNPGAQEAAAEMGYVEQRRRQIETLKTYVDARLRAQAADQQKKYVENVAAQLQGEHLQLDACKTILTELVSGATPYVRTLDRIWDRAAELGIGREQVVLNLELPEAARGREITRIAALLAGKEKGKAAEYEGLLRTFEKQSAKFADELSRMRRNARARGLDADRLLMHLGAANEELAHYQRIPDPTREKRGLRPPEDIQSKNYVGYAGAAFRRIDEMEKEDLQEEMKKQLQEQEETESWATDIGGKLLKVVVQEPWRLPAREQGGELYKLYEKIQHYINLTPEQRAQLRTKPPLPEQGGCVTPMVIPRADREAYMALTTLFLHGSKATIESIEKERAEQEARVATREKTPANIEKICKETRARLTSVMGKMLPEPHRELAKPLKHKVTDFLGLKNILLYEQKQAEIDLANAEKPSKDDTPESTIEKAIRAERTVEKLEEAWKLASTLDVKDTGFKLMDLPEGQKGYFSYKEGMIILDSKLKGKEYEDTFQHERGHALIHIFAKKTMLSPLLITQSYLEHAEKKADGGTQTFRDILLDPNGLTSPKNGFNSYTALRQQKDEKKIPEDEYAEALMDELINRYASWKKEKEEKPDEDPKGYLDEEVRLFLMLSPTTGSPLGKTPELDMAWDSDEEAKKARNTKKYLEDLEKKRRESRGTGKDRQMFLNGTPDDEENDPGGTGGRAPETNAGFNMKQNLIEIQRDIHKTKTFVEAYKTELPDIVAKLKVPLDSSQEGYETLWSIFTDKERRKEWRPTPEENKKIQDSTRALKTYTGKMSKAVEKIDVERLDTSTAPVKEKTGLAGIFKNVKLLSINDVIKLWKDTLEDIGTIYKRRQDRLLKEVGGRVTKALGNLPMPSYLSPYTKGLNAYHERRYSGAEVEAADKWKDGMKNVDTHELLHFLEDPHNVNKDAVRGVITLLCDRGEMDWGNEGVWKKLNMLSIYRMPIGPCKRDDILRDTWLRKLISQIWDDKELYYHWRTTNDSKIKHGKQEFTDTADQLANVGGMRAELAKQLKLMRQDPHHPPEDVKPHLYEEILEYAMRNGKMTMEDKFYYLVQGIDAKILSVERLRSLAGEKGEILMKFPFIDYFYQKNNSPDEIHELAERLRETDPEKEFEPGLKTTLFLYFDVAREESVRARISKATSRIAEGIDHEDVPFMITQLDYGTVNNLAAVISGTRQKVTTEGWKNAYVGFNTQFKVFGQLVNLDNEGYNRFTKNDAGQLVESMTSYLFMDNILTRKANDAKSSERPQLTEYQYGTPCPSGGDTLTGQYRTRMNLFIATLLQELRTATGINPNLQVDSARPAVTFDDFAEIANPAGFRPNVDTKRQADIYNATPKFREWLRKMVVENQTGYEVFRRVLKEFAEKDPERDGLINEGKQFTKEDVVEAWTKKAPPLHKHGNGH